MRGSCGCIADTTSDGDAIGQGAGQAAWVDPAHDAAGNMILMPRPTSITGTAFEASSTNALLCVYDAWNRMSRVYADSGTASRTLDGGDALVATYQYDGRNRRVAKLLPATGGNFKRTDYYYNENWQVLEERYIASVSGTATAATAASRKMLWDARYIDAPVWQWAASACYYYTTDANMNVTTWVLSGGTGPYTRYEYDPYGLPRQLDAGTWNRTSSADVSKTETLYCGYRYDPETGLYQVRERYYHPTLGRWGQWDRLHYLAGLDLLAYAGSCPSSHVDPSGLEEEIPESKVDPAYRSPDSNDLDYFDTPCDAVDNIKYKQSGMIVKRLLRYRLRTDFPRYGRVTAVTSITGIEGGAFHRAVQERIEEQQHSPGAPGAEWNARMLMAEWAEQEGLAPVETSIEITAADDVVVLRKIEAVIDAYWLCECAVAAAPATKPAGATASKPAAGWSADSPPNSGYSIALGSTFYEGKTLTDQRGDVQSGRTEERDNQYWVWRRVQYQNTPHIRLGVARRKALEEKLRVAGFNKPLPPGWIASTEVDTHDIDETTYKDIIATVQKGDPGTNVWIVVGK